MLTKKRDNYFQRIKMIKLIFKKVNTKFILITIIQKDLIIESNRSNVSSRN